MLEFKRALLIRVLCRIAIILASGCFTNGRGSFLGPECADYLGERGCCLVAAGGDAAAVDACREAATNYANAPDPAQAEASCRSAKEAAIAAGVCEPQTDGGTAVTDGGVSGDGPSSICERFVSCVYQVAPDQAAGATAAYGSDGSCWQTQISSVCIDGCRTGLDGLHDVHPSECPLCASDAECAYPTPAAAAAARCRGCTRARHFAHPSRTIAHPSRTWRRYPARRYVVDLPLPMRDTRPPRDARSLPLSPQAS